MEETSEKVQQTPEEAVFVQLLTEHQVLLRGFILALLPGNAGVDDVLQNANIVLWQNRASFEVGSNFRAWSCTIARFQAMAHLKELSRRRQVSLDPDVAMLIAEDLERNPDEVDNYQGYMNAIDHCLAKLREKDRDLILQRYWRRTGLQTFATISNRSVNSLKVTLFRLRVVLKRCIKNQVANGLAT
jgi:RNA polymerase sigma-70 factor, ECF subfamily